jgi:hypothetical protein
VGLGRPQKLRKLRLDSAGRTRPRSARYVQLALLALIAALGSVATYAFAGGSQAATMATLPNPDPPPTSTRQVVPPPEPPPPTTHTYVAPPPSQPPAQTYVAPTPAQQASRATAPLRPLRNVHHRAARHDHGQAKNNRLPAVTTPVRLVAPRELPRGVAVGVAVLPAAAVVSEDAAPLLRFALWIMLGLSLVVLAVALATPRVLPASVGIVVEERRGSLFYFGAATALGIGVGVASAWLGS